MIAALLFARMSSSRFPGKALKEFHGTPLILWVYQRAMHLNVDKILICTSTDSSDDILCDFLAKNNILFFRGDLNNVAERALQCCSHFSISSFVRINGDSPFFSVVETNRAIQLLKRFDLDFVTNVKFGNFPYGYSCEVFSAQLLNQYLKNFNESEKEHITSYFYKNISNFSFCVIKNTLQNIKSFRYTLDETVDVNFISRLLHNSIGSPVISLNELTQLSKDVLPQC